VMRRRPAELPAVALALSALFATHVRAQPPAASLSLAEVLSSTEAHHPQVAAALAREDVARAELFAARGGFDPTLSAYGALRTGGYYELRRLEVELRQPTPLWGAEVWAGYRIGRGIRDQRYPSYYSDQTLDGGELSAGIEVPLWRDGRLDSRRADRARAERYVDSAERSREATSISLRQAATDAYLGWVTAGQRLAVARELMTLAERRRTWVDARVEAGALPPIEGLEAERSVLSRRRSLVGARRGVEASALVLSLFHRDTEGMPQTPRETALPPRFPLPEPVSGDPEVVFARVVACQPALAAKRASLEALRVSRDYYQAQRAPRIDVRGQVSRDFGSGDESLPGTVFETGVVFSMPLAMRGPRGRLEAAEAELRAAEEELRLMEDTLRMRIGDALSAYRAAEEARALAEQMVANTRALADAERRRFEAGATTLFVVNLREQAIAEAVVAEADAVRQVWKARASWDALTTCR